MFFDVTDIDTRAHVADEQGATPCAASASPAVDGHYGDHANPPIVGKVLQALANECAAARAVIHGSRQPFVAPHVSTVAAQQKGTQ